MTDTDDRDRVCAPADGRPAVRVGLLWHSLSSDNLGIVAITEGQIRCLRRAAARAGVALRTSVFGYEGSRTCSIEASEIVRAGLPRPSRWGIRRDEAAWRLADCDLILDVGEGDGFSDIYGSLRLLALCGPRWRVRRGRPRVVLAPQTYGPFKSAVGRQLARVGLAGVEHAFARDPLSYRLLRERIGGQRTTLSTDLALDTPASLAAPPRGDGPVRVGINVSALLWNGGYDGRNQFDLRVDYRQLVTELVDELTRRGGHEIHLVAHVLRDDGSVDDDHALARALASARPETVVVAPPFSSPAEARAYMATLDHLSGARLHACIAGFTQGLATTCLAYSPKAAALFDGLGYPGVVDLRAVDTPTALTAIVADIENRTALATAARTGMVRAQALLARYEDFLVETLGDLACG